MKCEITSSSRKRALFFLLLLPSLCLQQGASSSLFAGVPFEETTSLYADVLLAQVDLDALKGEQRAASSLSASQPLLITKVAFEPSSPVSGDKLQAIVQADARDSTHLKVFYRWKINGQIVQESWESNLDCPVRRGEYIEVEATLNDGLTGGTARTHSTLVGNAPPTLGVVEQNIDNDGSYRARLEAMDPEGDSLTFSLKGGPTGMTVDPVAGTILWLAQPDTDGDFPVQVCATDAMGAETLLGYQIKMRWQKPEGAEKHANSIPASK